MTNVGPKSGDRGMYDFLSGDRGMYDYLSWVAHNLDRDTRDRWETDDQWTIGPNSIAASLARVLRRNMNLPGSALQEVLEDISDAVQGEISSPSDLVSVEEVDADADQVLAISTPKSAGPVSYVPSVGRQRRPRWDPSRVRGQHRNEKPSEWLVALLHSAFEVILFLKNFRGSRHRMWFSDLVVVSASGTTHEERVQNLVETKVRRADREWTVGEAIDSCGAFPESSPFLQRQWKEKFGLPDNQVIINVPVLLRTRTESVTALPDLYDPDPINPDRLDLVNVISLPWGGAADIAGLLALHWEKPYTSITKLERQLHRGSRITTGDAPFEDGASEIIHLRNMAKLSGILLDPVTAGSLFGEITDEVAALRGPWVSALDRPEATVRALKVKLEQDRVLNENGAPSPSRVAAPFILITMSEARIAWVAHRRTGWAGAGHASPEGVKDDIERLQDSQEQLTQLAEQLGDRQVIRLEFPDDGYTYTDEAGRTILEDPADQDFDIFWELAEQALAQITVDDQTVSPMREMYGVQETVR